MKFALTSVMLLSSMVASSMSMATGKAQECQSHSDCPSNKPVCDTRTDNSKCVNPCHEENVCGVNANCELLNLTPTCSCPSGMIGHPFESCRPITLEAHQECQSHSDCPSNNPVCDTNTSKCVNPCHGENVCGLNANCELVNHIPVCSCPKTMKGDPFKFCQPITDDDLCDLKQSCGANAKCEQSVIDGKIGVLCTCPAGFTGNALVSCERI